MIQSEDEDSEVWAFQVLPVYWDGHHSHLIYALCFLLSAGTKTVVSRRCDMRYISTIWHFATGAAHMMQRCRGDVFILLVKIESLIVCWRLMSNVTPGLFKPWAAITGLLHDNYTRHTCGPVRNQVVETGCYSPIDQACIAITFPDIQLLGQKYCFHCFQHF